MSFDELVSEAKAMIAEWIQHPQKRPDYCPNDPAWILAQLDEMLKYRDYHAYRPSFPRIITDSWDYDDALGMKLMEVSALYEELYGGKAKYELRLMFEWGGPADEGIVWGMNDAAKERFGGYCIKLDHLPISAGLREELIRLHAWHDTALDWEDPSASSPWSEEEKEWFQEESVQAFRRLCEELGPECHVVYDAFDYGQKYE